MNYELAIVRSQNVVCFTFVFVRRTLDSTIGSDDYRQTIIVR